MDIADLELLATRNRFAEVVRRWRVLPEEADVLLGLDVEGMTLRTSWRLSETVERRLRLLCELDRLLVEIMGGDAVADWLRSPDLAVDPLTFLSLGTDEIRAMLAAARVRLGE